jgi:hypothetical protein
MSLRRIVPLAIFWRETKDCEGQGVWAVLVEE